MDKYCLDCGKKLYSGNQSGRCVPCMNKHRANDPEFLKQCANTRALKKDPNYEIHKRYCIDCGQELKGHGSPLRCRSCSSKVVMKNLVEEGRAGTPCTEERKQRISEGMKAAHERGCYDNWMPKFIELGAENWNNPAVRKKFTEASHKYWADPTNRERLSETIKSYYAMHPEALESQRLHLERVREEFWSDPANHEKHSAFMRELWQDPAYAEVAYDHIYNVLQPAAQAWQSDPANKESMAKNMCKQMASMSFKQSSLEREVQAILDECDIEYIAQFSPPGYNRVYDFLLCSYKLLIEVDGWYWHASPDAISWGQAETDAEKDQWAVDNGYNILRMPEGAMRTVGARELLFAVI